MNPLLNDPQLMHHLEQSKVIRDIEHWFRDRGELSCEPLDLRTSRPVKKARLDTAQPNNAQQQAEANEQSSRQATTQPNQVNTHDTQIITLSLRCWESNCSDKFEGDNADSQLKDHLWNEHSIKLYPCQVKDCRQSFENTYILGKHIKQSHQSTTKLHCGKCPKKFTTYKLLCSHNHQLHQLGHFQCSFTSCAFTGECRRKVSNHYTQQHKGDFVCSQAGCHYRTPIEAVLKTHELAHLRIKPYRCKWANCHNSSSYQQNLLIHIKKHLARLESANQSVAHSTNPKDYLEVLSSTSELL